MNDRIKKEFRKYLKQVCKNRELRMYATSFFADFCAKYEGQHFTKDNFEMLEVEGKPIEQDIVKDIFSKQEKASAVRLYIILL